MGRIIQNTINRCLDEIYYPYISSPAYDKTTAETINYKCHYVRKTIIFGFCMVTIYAIVGSMLACLAYKVKRLVWKDEKIMPITLMFFTAYIFSAFTA